MTTDRIIDQISSLGYAVREFRVNGVVEFHAVPLKGPHSPRPGRIPQVGGCDAADAGTGLRIGGHAKPIAWSGIHDR